MLATGSLVGRRTELAQLGQILGADRGRAVLLCGEAGIGKTALMAHVCVQAVAEDWHVVRVLGVEAEESFALGGLHQLVVGLEEVLGDLDERERAALAPLYGGDPGSSVSAMQLLVAVLNLLTKAAQNRPVLLAVDDVQWLDDISATVLGALGRRLVNQRVSILAGQRVPSEPKFTTAGWTEMVLDPLDSQDSAQLLGRSAQLTADVGAAILAAAAGNPLALVELPRCADQVQGWSGTVPLTDRLLKVFGGRLQTLDPSVRVEMLRAALDGTPVNTSARTHGRYVMTDVQQAVAAGLLVVNPLGQPVFRHPLVCAAVIHRASEQERRDAHRELAGLYDDVLVRRASHLAAAVTGPDQEVADLLARAAQMSIRQGGLRVAVDWLNRAAELSSEPDRRRALTAEAVFVAARAGQFDKAQDLSERNIAGETDSAANVLAAAYLAFHGRGEVIAPHRSLLRALEGAATLDDDTVNRLVNLLITITNYAGDTVLWQQANAAVESVAARVDPVIVLHRRRFSDIATTAQITRALLSDRLGRLTEFGPREVMQLAFPAYCVDALADLRSPLTLAYDKAREDGASIDAVAAGCVVMLDLMATGDWAQAEKVGLTCLEMAQQVQGGVFMHHFLANLGILAAWRGDVEAARRYATEVTEWSRPRGMGTYLDYAKRITVLAALAEGDFEAAYQATVSICPPERFPPMINQVGDGMLDLVEASISTGRLDEARAYAEVVTRLRIAEVSPRLAALTIAVSAMTAPDSEAGELYESALSHPGLADFPFEHARITLAQGMWLRRQRRHTQARDTLRRAAKAFDHLGAQTWADRAHAEFRASAATGNRFTEQNAPLSPQERRIAELAATGATSKQIAAQLTVSPRTVDTHLRNLYPKLGITSRAALGEALRKRESEPS